jgi:hypothetical protein
MVGRASGVLRLPRWYVAIIKGNPKAMNPPIDRNEQITAQEAQSGDSRQKSGM